MGVKEDQPEVIRSWPKMMRMKCYTKKEILSMSVKEITSTAIGNDDKVSAMDGLYDPALGPTRRGEICVTCGLQGRQCPGHCGHITLADPVYNVLFYSELKQILKATCRDCSQFLCHESQVIIFEAKLEALELHSLDCYNEICAIEPQFRDRSKYEDAAESARECFDKIIQKYRSKQSEEGKLLNRGMVEIKQELVDQFYKMFGKTIKKCPRCQSAVSELKFEVNGQTKVLVQKCTDPDIDLDNASSSDSEDEEKEVTEDGKKIKTGVQAKKARTGKGLSETRMVRIPCREIFKHVKRVFKCEKRIMNLLYSGQQAELFFIEVILVPPNKFRPMNVVNDSVAASDRTVALKNIIAPSEQLKWLKSYMAHYNKDEVDPTEAAKTDLMLNKLKGKDLKEKYENLEVEMQSCVNIMIDSTKERNIAEANKVPGAKQRLEKKSGLFRMNIMGKRVNFCARTVITPDPNISTNEFGVPEWIAKRLTYPETVTQYNYNNLRKAVLNGPNVHPGANAVIGADGRIERILGGAKNEHARRAIADQLLKPTTDSNGLTKMKKVIRHLKNGDAILANRQPTLHKGSIMAHRAKVTKGEYTFRLHYSNCKHYNADFDGDEMNLHLPQTEEARAEAEMLMNTDHMYRSAKDGFPLAGLMQDHIIAGVTMTFRDKFFNRAEYQDLLFSALSASMPNKRIKLLPPTIFKPKELWTGKQVLSTLIQNLCNGSGPNFIGECKMKGKDFFKPGAKSKNLEFSSDMNDATMNVRNGYVWVFDKQHAGPGKYGIVAAIEEIYGGSTAGAVISGMARIFTHYLKNYRGFTLGIKDVITRKAAVAQRDEVINVRAKRSLEDMSNHFNLGKLPDPAKKKKYEKAVKKLDEKARDLFRSAHLVGTHTTIKEIDSVLKMCGKGITENIEKICLDNLAYRFPENNLELMITVGAKGSKANLLNMMSALGQVELDGKRAPLMPSGRSLPCWTPYEYDIRAGAFIANRYGAGGLRPQEFFFHCMAGRDGLIDTSCKTASSGYLQRCLIKAGFYFRQQNCQSLLICEFQSGDHFENQIKHLEGIVVAYDRTVRDHDKSVIQFHYGEDGLDVPKTPYLNPKQFSFIADNFEKYKTSYFGSRDIPDLSSEIVRSQKKKEKYIRKMTKGRGWVEKNVGGIHRVLGFNDFINKHEKLVKMQERINRVTDYDEIEPYYSETGKSEIKTRRRQYVDQFNFAAKSAWHPVVKIRDAVIEDDRIVKPPKFDLNPTEEQIEKKGHIFPDEVPMNEDNRQKFISLHTKLMDPNLSTFSPDLHTGSTGELFYSHVMCYKNQDPTKTKDMRNLLFEKYRRSLVDPGDQVGLVISQSIGEPSTQMTLNTFHLAGKADVNITLGIPRLRELLMTAPTAVKTPMMSIPFHHHITKGQAEAFVKKIRNIMLSDVITKVCATEKLEVSQYGTQMLTSVRIELGSELCKNHNMLPGDVLQNHLEKKLFKMFVVKLQAAIKARSKTEMIMNVKDQD